MCYSYPVHSTQHTARSSPPLDARASLVISLFIPYTTVVQYAIKGHATNSALRALAAEACSTRWDTALAHTNTHAWSGRVCTATPRFQCLPQLGRVGLVRDGAAGSVSAAGYGTRGGVYGDPARHAAYTLGRLV